MTRNAKDIQAAYYKDTASNYDIAHIDLDNHEHFVALHFLSAAINLYSIRTILDVGAGTGRTISFILKNHPEVTIVGIEPVRELREQAHLKGISRSALLEGDGNRLGYGEREFDLVCAFGVLHHVAAPANVIGEMLRVSRKGIFISDGNNFGQGSAPARFLKQLINSAGLWRFYNFARTKGKGYQISEGDGLFYSYSVFDNYDQIKKECPQIHLLNTKGGGTDLYRTASHVALLGVKESDQCIV